MPSTTASSNEASVKVSTAKSRTNATRGTDALNRNSGERVAQRDAHGAWTGAFAFIQHTAVAVKATLPPATEAVQNRRGQTLRARQHNCKARSGRRRGCPAVGVKANLPARGVSVRAAVNPPMLVPPA
jgi:hypothetical protein